MGSTQVRMGEFAESKYDGLKVEIGSVPSLGSTERDARANSLGQSQQIL
jgi:hypothetical protein